jgi:transposase InsO family protein
VTVDSDTVTGDSDTVTGDSEQPLGIGHVKSEWPVTFRRNKRSRSIGMGGHLGSEYARYDWLGQYLFNSIAQVQEYATRWLWTYNHERPNMALGGITPKQKLALAA